MDVVTQLFLGFPAESGLPDASGCRLDVLESRLVSFDDAVAIDVSLDTVRDLLAAGILKQTVTEFAEWGIALNLSAIKWTSNSCIAQGSRHPLHHVVAEGAGQLHDRCKLLLMMWLHSQGWQQFGEGDAVELYVEGAPRHLDFSAARSRY